MAVDCPYESPQYGWYGNYFSQIQCEAYVRGYEDGKANLTLLPDLSLQDANSLALMFAGVLAIVFTVKQIQKMF